MFVPQCPACGSGRLVYAWRRFQNGSRHIHAGCRDCGRFCGWAPRQPYYATRADGLLEEADPGSCGLPLFGSNPELHDAPPD